MASGASSFATGDETGVWGYDGYSSLNGLFQGQSFQQGQSNIDKIEIYMYSNVNIFLTLFLANTFDGDAPLASGPDEIEAKVTDYVPVDSNHWVTFTLPTTVSIGPTTTYWIVLNSSWDSNWGRSTGDDPYGDGNAYGLVNDDFGFRTFYDDAFPEFDTPLLLMLILSVFLGGIFLIIKRKR